ncbi:glutamine synthetase beta-grasp domain-containing protein [Flavobacterium sp. MC2016-06]|uniref:glutamine synthetase beta-grasp domain-containing protein n=1 Tax=Flavobacterium sp. MC2016-06 TaxID=2676308 RepID=UPI0012BAD65B|nr:glutamine synthetase beta-grasp domain-containing protein [Flavobacterium sp. MC2016-06]MBU3857770.1 glutamine synthetase beta-grasp domain-containing protein [Flavobacterium sp. MC2016-06]
MVKFEYVWLDGSKPTQGLRSKTKIAKDFDGKLESIPLWSFDGSSTKQAPGGSSDCILKPVYFVEDPLRNDAYLIMCEVLNADGTNHESNGRATIEDNDNDFWFGFEQEYFLWNPQTDKPLGFPSGGYPAPQGPYYCSAGAANAFGRNMVEKHLDACMKAGINIEGINAEVAAGQWEFQIFGKGAKSAGDQIWIARYLLERIGEEFGVSINWHCKPLGELDWNGSGMHANFSNTLLRTAGSKAIYDAVCEAFRPVVEEHMEVYGADNHMRLTGLHETAAITDFSYGVSDRGASIRIPVVTVENGWKGYLEDRRPNSAADPYKVAARIIKTVKSVDFTQKAELVKDIDLVSN